MCIYVAKNIHHLHLQSLIITYFLAEFIVFYNTYNNFIFPFLELIFFSYHEALFQTKGVVGAAINSPANKPSSQWRVFYVWAHSGACSMSSGEIHSSETNSTFEGVELPRRSISGKAVFVFPEYPLLANPPADVCCLLEKAVFKPSCLVGSSIHRTVRKEQ